MSILNTAKGFIEKASHHIDENSPKILLGLGIAAGLAGTVLACRATLKARDIIMEANDGVVTDIHKTYEKVIAEETEKCEGELPKETSEKITKDMNIDLALAWGKTGLKVTKEYIPAVVLGALSIASFCKSYSIMNCRNAVLSASLYSITSEFNEYRERVIAKLGKEYDSAFRYGTHMEKVTVTETDENGNEVTKEVEKEVLNNPTGNMYSVLWGPDSNLWQNSNTLNLRTLTAAEKQLNWLLESRGWVTYNDFLEAIGLHALRDMKKGLVVGWVKGKGKIDFRLNENEFLAQKCTTEFYMIDPNVQGCIYGTDKAELKKKAA